MYVSLWKEKLNVIFMVYIVIKVVFEFVEEGVF